MYGMSAKDRLAMFENNGNSKKKTNSGPKKPGKLKIGNSTSKANEEPKKAVPPKKAKSTQQNDDKKEIKEKAEVKKDTKPTEQPKDEPVMEKKEEKMDRKEQEVTNTKKEEKLVEKMETDEEKKENLTEGKDENKPEITEKANKAGSSPAVETKTKENPTPNPKETDKTKESIDNAESKSKEPQKEGDKLKEDTTKEREVKKKEDTNEKEASQKENIKDKDVPKKKDVQTKEAPKKEIKTEKPKKEGEKTSKKGDVGDDKKAEGASLQSKEDEISKQADPKNIGDTAAPVRKRRRPQFVPVPEEVYDTLFYFSGMGTVVGSAMNEGVYVPVRATKTALETEVIDKVEADKEKEREQDTVVIRTARTQAFDIAEQLRKLQGLLNGLPNFGQENSDLHKIDAKPVDNIMHAKYHNFQQVPQGPPRVKPLEVTLSTTRKDVPPKPVAQWPPPVIPAPQKAKETPISMHSVPTAQTKPVVATGTDKNVGVFKGVKSDAPSTKLAPKENQPRHGGARPYGVYTAKPASGSTQSWQDKYGSKSVDDIKGPQPFQHGDEIPGGLKPWELSRLRGLEAKGYQFAHLEPKSGADYSDSFYHGSSSLELEGVELKSLAPYLVSGRSQSVDRGQKEATGQAPVSAATFSLKKHSGYGSHGENLPYFDV